MLGLLLHGMCNVDGYYGAMDYPMHACSAADFALDLYIIIYQSLAFRYMLLRSILSSKTTTM